MDLVRAIAFRQADYVGFLQINPGSRQRAALETGEGHELRKRRAFGDKLIFELMRVGIPDGQAADDNLAFGPCEQRPDQGMEVGERCLRASIEPPSGCGDEQTSDKNPKIKPTADLDVLIQRKDHADRCPDEIVVPTTLALRALEVTFADPKQAVKIPANLATTTKKGFAPVERVIVSSTRAGTFRSRPA